MIDTNTVIEIFIPGHLSTIHVLYSEKIVI